MGWFDDISFDFLKGEGFGAATASTVDAEGLRQEDLGRSIIEAEINRQSREDLSRANQHAADSFEAYYGEATAGPQYDPFADDPYHGTSQEVLGRAIVQQSVDQGRTANDPLNLLNSPDVASWAGVLKGVVGAVLPGNPGGTVNNVPRQVFPSGPNNGRLFAGSSIFSPGVRGASVSQPGGDMLMPLLVLGAVGVGLYVALK